jgi:hypothetical protein
VPRLDGRVAFSGGVALAALWALAQTAGWPAKAALYPRAVGIPLFLLAVAETLLSLRGRAEPEAATMDVALSADVAPDVARRRTLATAGWLVGFYLAVLLVGFPVAVPAFVLGYLRAQAREGWPLALLLTAGATGGFHLLFVRLLHVPFAEGLLWRWLAR